MTVTHYKKLNFNIPALHNDGTQLMRTKVNREKIKRQPDGRVAADPVLDDEGYAIQEPVLLCEILAQVVDNIYPGEEELTMQERVTRGKLARKVSDKTDSALKNYQAEEWELIRYCLTKANASPSILAQVDDMIHTTPSDE